MAVSVAPALSARLPHLKLPPTSESLQPKLHRCVGHAYHNHYDETFTKTLELPTLLPFDVGLAPPCYDECINDCPPDYTTSDALATISSNPPPYAPSPPLSAPTKNGKESSGCSHPKVDFGYRDNLREHKKKNKKNNAAAKNKWESDNEEEKKPEGDANGDQPGGAGGTEGAGGDGGDGGDGGGNDDDDWDDGKKKGKKDKKKSAFSWDALEDEENKDDVPPPAEDPPAEEDEWAGFTTAASKKKKKKAKNADPDPALDDPKPDDGPPKVDVDFDNNNSFSFGSNGAWGNSGAKAEDDGWATFGASKKDKKKKTSAFDFGFGDAGDEGEMPGEPAPAIEEEEAKANDNPWAAFGTGKKKKKKGGAAEESPPAPEPEPEPVIDVQSPDEPADDFTWGMSAKDKKKAKKAAKAAALAESDPIVAIEEPQLEPEVVVPEPEPAPVDDFSWGMSAKDKKKAKKAAKKAGNAFEFIAEPEPEPTLAPEPEPPVVEAVEEAAPPAPVPEPTDDFSWGMSAKDKKKAKKAKKNAFDWSEPDPPAAPEPPPVIEASPAPVPDASIALAIPEPPQDDWFGWGTATKKKGKKDAEEVPLEVSPPPAVPEPAVEESTSSWSFSWGSTSKKDKNKKSKSPEPEPLPELALEPVPIPQEEPPIMVPESIDEPKANEDEWAGWATGKKSKKKGSKNAPVEVVEPVYDIPVQQPDPVPAEDDAWAGWSVGKKEKKKAKKSEVVPPPPLAAIEPPPIEVVEPVISPPPESKAPVEQVPADDPWASFSTKKSKKDKKKKCSDGDEVKPIVEIPPPPSEPEQLVDLQKPAPELEPQSNPAVAIDSVSQEEPVKESKKKEVKASSGWGSLWGSSSKSKTSSKDKEKEKRGKEEKEEKERLGKEAEEKRKAEEEAAFAAALADEPADLLPEAEPVKVENTGYWGTFLKPTVIKNVEKSATTETKVSTGAKESVKDKIKRLQGEATKAEVVVPPPAAPEPEPLPEPETIAVPEPETITVPEPVVEDAPVQKPSKDKEKKKGKEVSPPPHPATIKIPPPVVEVPPSLSPIPGGFPEDDDVVVDVLADAPAVTPIDVIGGSADAPIEPPPIEGVIPSEEVKPKSPPHKKSVKEKNSSVKKPTKPSRPVVVDLAAPTTPTAEAKAVKKERPKVVRDQTGGSQWAFWGVTPKTEVKKEHGPSKDTTAISTPTVKRSTAPGLTRSKSARKATERDIMDKVDRLSGDDKPSRRESKDRPTPSRGMSFSLFGPTPSRTKSMRQSSSSAQRPAQVRESRRSLEVSSPPVDIASKAAKLMGLGPKPSLNRSQSMREKRKSRTVPDPYAVDVDNTPDDATHSASADRSGSHGTKRSSRSNHMHDKRDSAVMSGGLGQSDGDGHGNITAPEDTPFVTPSRPPLKRSATTSARKPAGSLFSNILDSLKPKPVEDLSRRHRSSRAYDNEGGSARKSRHRTPHSSHHDDDEDSKRHLRREHRRVHRPEDVPHTSADDTPATPAAENTEIEDRERRRAERRAKRAALEAAEEDLRAREKAARRRERENAERAKQDEEDQSRRQRRAERHASRRSSAVDPERKPHLHRSSTAPSYFDARAPHRDANGRDPRSPPKDKTSSWVNSVSSSPPPPPPLQPTILDLPPAEPVEDDNDGLRDDESTARELRRRHRREREIRGVETEEDRKRRKRKELRRKEEELERRGGNRREGGGGNKAYNSLGYDGFETQKTWDGRVVGNEGRGGVKEDLAKRTQGWFKKVAGL